MKATDARSEIRTTPFFMCVETKKTDFHPGEEIIALGNVKDPTTNKPVVGAEVELQLLDPSGRSVATAVDKTVEEGRFHATLKLPEAAVDGVYQLTATHQYSTAVTSVKCSQPKGAATHETQ